jgi:PEP-CTERM motif-containing protein
MLKRVLTGAAAALTVSLCLAGTANAAIVDFNDVVFTPDPIGGLIGAIPTADGFDHQGLHFFTGEGYFVPPGLPVDAEHPPAFPTSYSTTFWETFGENVVITKTGGGLFDLTSLKLGLGVDSGEGEPTTDTIDVSWVKGGSCVTDCADGTTIDLGLGFATYDFPDLTGLTSITFGPTNVLRYLAFDDINVPSVSTHGAVPEPGAWTLMLLGLGGIGALMRRGRRTAIQAA